MPQQIEVLMPTSSAEATQMFGEIDGITVVGGATIVMPDLRVGRLRTERVMLLVRAGMDYIEDNGDRLRIGAATPLSSLGHAPEPLAGAIANIADPEIRAQATVAGNLCAPPGVEAPRGDLQGALIALNARVRWTDGASDHVDGVEAFLAQASGRRLVREIELPAPEQGAFAALRRPHSHGYTPLAVSAAVVDGELRLAATGLGPHGTRLRSADDPTPVEGAAVTPIDDALASGWYRGEMLPVLVRRCLEQMGMAA
jgi:aerobic carbon-monoxide dehydrogenase medium subunit